MADKVEKMGRSPKKAETALERRARRAANAAELDGLLEDARFRAFLGKLADRAGYIAAEAPRDEWTQGYRAALRDVVNGVVVNSSRGAAWLAAYVAGKAENRDKEDQK